MRVLLLGRIGVGKSSTISSLAGKRLLATDGRVVATRNLETYDLVDSGTPFQVFDAPGLRGDEDADARCLGLIQGSNLAVDRILYVSPLSEGRVCCEEERAIQLYTRAMGSSVWNKAIFVLTFADRVPDGEYENYLAERARVLRYEVSNIVGADLANKIPVVGASNVRATTPDGKAWIVELYRIISIGLPANLKFPSYALMDAAGTKIQLERKMAAFGIPTLVDPPFEFVMTELHLIHEQARKQASTLFNQSVLAALSAFIVVVIGLALAIAGRVAEATAVAIAGVFPGLVAKLFFDQSKAANIRMDVIRERLNRTREIAAAVQITNSMLDTTSQDQLKERIVKWLLDTWH